MKALVCKAFGSFDSMSVEDVPAPVPEAKQVLITVKAASINYPDTLIVLGRYQAKPQLPFIPGAELAGVVKAVGPGVVHIVPGTSVLALSMRGAFAEEVAVNADAVFPLNGKVSMAAAASLPMTYGTAYHALLDRAHLKPAETLLVLGAGGGIGIAAVELGKLMGATVIAAASSTEKLEAATRCGADHVINYATEDLRTRLNEITRGRSIDVVCDPVGGAYAEPALRALGWGGRYLVIGFAGGDIPRLAFNLPLLKGSAVVGVFWGEFLRRDPARGFSEMRALIQFLESGRITPLISKAYPLADARLAFEALAGRRAIGKLIIEP